LDISRYEDTLKELDILKNEIETYLKWWGMIKEWLGMILDWETEKLLFKYEKHSSSSLLMKVYYSDKLGQLVCEKINNICNAHISIKFKK
jgi:hypothetical protein